MENIVLDAEKVDRLLQLLKRSQGLQIRAYFEAIGRQLPCTLDEDMEISNLVVEPHAISFIGQKAGQAAVRFLAQGKSRERFAQWLKAELSKPMFPRGGLKQIPNDVLFFAGTTEVVPAVRQMKPVATVAM